MASGTTLGKAYVQIIPSAQGIAGSISSLLAGESTAAGQAAGLNIANAIKGAIAAAGIGLTLRETISSGMNFDAEMSHVAAISGATGEEFDILRKKALEMGAATKFSASESAAAFGYMAMAGWDAGQMVDGIEGIMSLAAADGLDLATTSDIVTDALTAFGLKAVDASHFADVLAVASSSANTNVAMMGETFKYVAPIAGSMGINVEDTAEAIGLMANAGIKSSQAGTELRSVLTRLATNAGASSKSLGALDILTEKLGVEFYDSTGNVRDFSDVLSEARIAWSGLSAEQQTSYGKIIAGQEAMSGWLALMNAAPEDIAKLENALETADGMAEHMADVMQDNLPGAVTIFQSAMEGLQIALYDKFSGAMKSGVQESTNFVGAVTEAVRSGDLTPLQEWAGSLAEKLISGIREKTAEVSAVIYNMIPLEVISFLEDIFFRLLDVFQQVSGTAQAVFPEVSDTVSGAFERIRDALSPLISRFIDWMRQSASAVDAGQILSDTVIILAAGIGTVADVTATVVEWLADFVDWLASGSTGADAFKAAVAGLTAGFVAYKTVTGLLTAGQIALAAAEKGVTAAQTLLNAVMAANPIGLVIAALTALAAAFIYLWNTNEDFRKFWINAWDTIKSTAMTAKDAITGAFRNIVNGVTDLKNNVVNKFNEMTNAITAKINAAKTWGRDLIDNFVSGIMEKWNALTETVGDVAGTVMNFLGFSEPEEGPLSDFHTYAPDMMELFASGIDANAYRVSDALNRSLTEWRDEPALSSTLMYDYSSGAGAVFPDIYGARSADSGELIDALRDALSGMGVYMSGQKVGTLVRKNIRNDARASGNGYALV